MCLNKIVVPLIILIIEIFAQEITYNQEFRMCSTTCDYNYDPVLSVLPDSNFIVCWNGVYNNNNSTDIRGQLFNNRCTKMGNEFQVNSYRDGDQYGVNMCTLINNTFFINWINEAEVDGGAWGQFFQASGESINGNFKLFPKNAEWVEDLCNVIGLKNGNMLICWCCRNLYGSADKEGILGQIFDNSGKALSDVIYFYESSDNLYQIPSAIELENGDILVVWLNDRVFGQLLEPNGEKKDHRKILSSIWLNNAYTYKITNLGKSGLLLSYVRDGNEIVNEMLNQDGTRSAGSFTVNIRSFNFDVCQLSENQIAFLWNAYSVSDNAYTLQVMITDLNGNLIYPQIQVGNHFENPLWNPKIYKLSNERFIICFERVNQNGPGHYIYARYYLSSPLTHPLVSFNLRYPKNDETVVTTVPKFYWDKASEIHMNFSWEMTYDLYLDTDPSFNQPRIIKNIDNTYFTNLIDTLKSNQTYFWKVLAKNIAGDSIWSSDTNGFYVSPDATATGIEALEQPSPTQFELKQNYPNPFNPTTTIPIVLAEQSRVTVKVYNIMGQVVATLARDQAYSAGRQLFVFDGNGLAGGIYFVEVNIITISGEKCRYGKKMLMVK